MADESAPQSNPAPAEPPATGDDALRDAGKAALDSERAARREAERSAKALQRELEQLRTVNLSETERAIAEAEKRGETNALGRIGHRLVDSELRLATAGRSLTTDALLTFDRAQFLTADGDVDREGLSKWVEQHSSAETPSRPKADVDQGARSVTTKPDMNAALKAAFGR